MIQENFNLEESQLQFLDECRSYGFKDKSAVVRMPLIVCAASSLSNGCNSRQTCTQKATQKTKKFKN